MKTEINRWDILITSEAPFGEVYLWDSEEKIVLSQRLFAIRCKENFYPKFVYQYLTSEYFQSELRGRATGTTVTGLRQTELLKCKVSYPNYEEQKRIADILSILDDKIELNKQMNKNLEEQAQAIFKSWFVDFEPWGGVMPEDWSIITFSDFLKPRNEKSNDPEITLFSVTDNGIIPRGDKFKKNLSSKQTKNKIIYNSDLVFGMSREILNWGIMRDDMGGVSSAYNVFIVDRSVNSKYLESFIKMHSKYFKDLIRPATREGQGIDKSALMMKSIYLPTNDVISRYYAIEDSLKLNIYKNNTESQKLANIRDILLPKLMNREILL